MFWNKKPLNKITNLNIMTNINSSNEKEQAHALLEKLALEKEAELLLTKDKVMENLILDHEKDKKEYKFECIKYGDLLNISIERISIYGTINGIVQYNDKQNYIGAINLKNVNSIQLIEGNIPDLTNSFTYNYRIKSNDGKNHFCYNYQGDKLPKENETIEIYQTGFLKYDNPPYKSLFINKNNEKNWGDGYGGNGRNSDYYIKHRTENWPASALDDQIYFNGTNEVICAPAGRGKEVLDKILNANNILKKRKK